MSDEVRERQLILDTFEKMEQLQKKREEQARLMHELHRLLSHKYFWPDAYAGGALPKILFSSSPNVIIMTMTKMDTGESRVFRFHVKRVPKARANCMTKWCGMLWPTLVTLDNPPEGKDISADIMLEVLQPYLDTCL